MGELHFERALLPDGWASDVRVRFEDGVITGVASGVAPGSGERQRGVTVPGMANLHSHTFQRGMAGLAERAGASEDSFWTWREVMYRFLDRLSPEDIEAIAAQAFVEMVESGFTSCVEFHYLHHDPSGQPYANIAETGERIAAAAAATEVGLTLLPVLYRFGGFGGAVPSPGQRRFLNTVEQYGRLLEASEAATAALSAAVVGVAPHSLRAVSAEDLRWVAAARPDAPIHIHVAEQEKEVADCVAWSGQRPVAWLLDTLPVDPRWCLIHATHMTVEETERMAKAGAIAGLCPITEANLGDGLFQAAAFLAAGGRLGVGSDSNVLISLAEELRTLEYGQRLFQRRRNRLAPPEASVGRTVFDMALDGGAQAAGRRVGRIAPGWRADFVRLDDSNVALAGRRDDSALDSWIFAARLSPVADVWIGGRQVVCEGRHARREATARCFTAVIERMVA